MIVQMLGNFAMTLVSLVQILAEVLNVTPFIFSVFPSIITAVAGVAIAMGILRLIWW